MANNYSQFSEGMFENLTAEEEKWITEVLGNLEEKNTEDIQDLLGDVQFDAEMWPGFQFKIEEEREFSGSEKERAVRYLWLYSNEHVCTDNVIAFLQAFIREFRPDAIVSFTWADYCSRLRIGEFGGGWGVVTAEKYETGSAFGEAARIMKELSAEGKKSAHY
jgi:hypothetical protein